MQTTIPDQSAPATVSRHTLVALLRDRPGALHRAVTLFRRRSFNIASLHVERTGREGLSRMLVSVEAHSPDPLMRELARLVDVLSVRHVAGNGAPTGNDSEVPVHWQADGAAGEGETP